MNDKIVLLDLDESLVSSLYASNEEHADQLLETYSQYWDGVKFKLANDGWYVSFVRFWSRELIKYFQMTLGLNNVCILSWGSNEYVLRAAKELNLDIPPNNIFTREDIGSSVPRFKNKNCVLMDNETYHFHTLGIDNKVKFLYNLPSSKLITITNFDVRYFQEGLDHDIQDIINRIEQAFES